MSLRDFVRGAVNLLRSRYTCQLLLVFTQENLAHPEFMQQLRRWESRRCSAVCGIWKGMRFPYTSSEVLGVVEKTPGQLLSFVQLERALCGLHVKCTGLTLHKRFANTVTGLCQHVGWMKELSTTRIHSLSISPFSPCLPSGCTEGAPAIKEVHTVPAWWCS